MREILFRGQAVGSRVWIYGYYRKAREAHTIYHDESSQNCFIVYPETVGQFTGLTDKNGKKIFEGDIVTACDEITFSAFEFGITGKVVYDECAFFIEPKDVMETQYLFNECAVYEVIGNIHDNPELLGGTENET